MITVGSTPRPARVSASNDERGVGRAFDERGVGDPRLAFAVLTTYWYRKGSGRRLHLSDLPAFHRAFGSERFKAHGVLSREQLLVGADRLLGAGFGDGYGDDARRAWGIVFPTLARYGFERTSTRPSRTRVS